MEALRRRLPSCEALYYKEGDFLGDGSLIHFELSQLADLEVGLLEWATPECRGAVELACVGRAQEELLREAAADASAAFAGEGRPGQVFLLKNNVDRAGNAYGCHESYSVQERPGGLRRALFAYLLHPLVLALGLAVLLVISAPVVGVVRVAALAYGLLEVLSPLPLLGALARLAQRALVGAGQYLGQPGPLPGQGAVARLFLVLFRALAWGFSLTAREVLFTGHLPALVPFLVTRPLLCGAGHLTAEGRFELSARGRITDRVAAAFVYGPTRPLVDLKEFFFQRLFAYRAPRKRLQLLCGDANRAEASALLKLGATAAVLEALEAGALDGLVARIELVDGPLAAFRRTCADLSLQATVAIDRATGETLTAAGVQRRYLEATWARARADGDWPAELVDALRRWDDALRRVQEEPASLARELDWAIKLDLLRATLQDALPARTPEQAWSALRAWGPINALLERHAPEAPLPPPGAPAEAVAARLRTALGRARFGRARRAAAQAELDWAELPAVRAAWLRLKVVDLKYHELSAEGGYYDWLEQEGRVARLLDPAGVQRARSEPPQTTRARLRGLAIARLGRLGERAKRVRAGWDRIEVGPSEGGRRFDLKDPDQTALPALEELLAAEKTTQAEGEG